MIDMHCHMDLYQHPGRVIAEADKRGTYVIAVTTTPKAFLGNLRLAEGRKRIRVAVGLHPELVAERHREVDDVCKLMPQTKYVGEIGVDGSPPHAGSIGLQKNVFLEILKRADELGGKILSVHSRGASTTVLDCLAQTDGKSVPILHWFSGNMKEMQRAIDMGCWFSVGPAMLKSKKGRELANAIPRSRLLTETDGPFGTSGDSPLMPWDAEMAIPIIADLWGATQAEVAGSIRTNFRNLLQTSELEAVL